MAKKDNEPAAPKLTAEQKRAASIEKRQGQREASGIGKAGPSGTAAASEYPLLAQDMTPEEISSGEERLRQGAAKVHGTQFKQGTAITEGADDMSIDAISDRFRRHIDTAEWDALQATKATGQLHIPANTTWYGEHHGRFQDIANDTGVTRQQASAAGAAMSPANDPIEVEVPAVRRMAEFVTGSGGKVTVTPQASAHILQAQTKPNARDRERQANPTIVPEGEHEISDLSPDQLAVLGSISGATYNPNPTKLQPYGPEQVSELGFNPDDMKKDDRLHEDLEGFRPLGNVRNRQNVETAGKYLTGEETWDTKHPDPLLQPSKITSYNISAEAAVPVGTQSDEYNYLVRLHGKEGMQYQLPLAHSLTSAQDFWQKEAALGVTYEGKDSVNVKNKPASAAFDSGIPTAGLPASGLGKDQVTHALLNEAQMRSIHDIPISIGAAQAITWAGEREPKSNADQMRMAPQLPSAESLKMYEKELDRVNGRSNAFHTAAKPKAPKPEVPGQLSFDI